MARMYIENNKGEHAQIEDKDFPFWQTHGFFKSPAPCKMVIGSEKVKFVNIGMGEGYKVGEDVPLAQQVCFGQLVKEVPLDQPKEEEPTKRRRKIQE
jgi:hypothetical protein